MNLIIFSKKLSVLLGGGGFVGSKLVDELLKFGCKVRVLTRKNFIKDGSDIEVFTGDLSRSDLLLNDFIIDCDILFHCAGEMKNQTLMRPVHVEGTRRLINIARKEVERSNKKMHWIQLSSCGAYGPPPEKQIENKRIITELSASNPSNEYEITKTESDNLVINSCYNDMITYTILRPSNIIGPSMNNKSIFSLIKFVKSGLCFYIGKKDATATFVHIEDVVRSLLYIATNPKGRNEIFNLSCDCSWESLMVEIAGILKVKIIPLRLPYRLMYPLLKFMNLIFRRLFRVPLFTSFFYRTHYPTSKIENCLDFKFVKPLPWSIIDVIDAMKR